MWPLDSRLRFSICVLVHQVKILLRSTTLIQRTVQTGQVVSFSGSSPTSTVLDFPWHIYILSTQLIPPTFERNCKIPSLTEFFGTLQQEDINPTFMFSDKDASEIQAIRNVWGNLCGKLCIWHLKQAVDRGLARGRALDIIYDVNEAMQEFVFVLPDFLPNRVPGSQLATKNQRNAIITMMGEHSCRHPIFNCRKMQKKNIESPTCIDFPFWENPF
jgi:hypothetical protein